MDMYTIALIKGLIGNGGGGSSLPTDPAQDGTYNLQNTVSGGTSTLSWASGSSGGGVLVVNGTWDDEGTTCTLDKTWQEIHDGGFGVVASDVGDGIGYYYISSISSMPFSGQYVVSACSLSSEGVSQLNFSTNSASGYPVFSS